MSVLEQLASSLNIRGDEPNQELAGKLVDHQDREGIKELAENVGHKNANIASDCIKTLYEIGYKDPALIEEHVAVFLKAIHSRNNRLVWGGMIALGTIADRKAPEIFQQVDFIINTFENGSVITIDNAVLVLAKVASAGPDYEKVIFPALIHHLKGCRAKEIPQHAEKTLYAIHTGNMDTFLRVLESRMDEMTASQASRVKKIIREARKKTS